MQKLYVVGIGPGDPAQQTAQAAAALSESELICGYEKYIEIVRPLYPEKRFYSTPMHQELERCQYALESASNGVTTTMVCSGDAGVYGLSGPILSLSEHFRDVDIVVIPGITAALSGAALIGAPLMNDFMVLSLSDLLTPWELIERRLYAAAFGDLVLCLYNPGSHRRRNHLRRAAEILLRGGKAPETICAIVRNIGREDSSKDFCLLSDLIEKQVDMFTIVYIGCSQTTLIHGNMITARGYPEIQI